MEAIMPSIAAFATIIPEVHENVYVMCVFAQRLSQEHVAFDVCGCLHLNSAKSAIVIMDYRVDAGIIRWRRYDAKAKPI
jgi:hypothetical protein